MIKIQNMAYYDKHTYFINPNNIVYISTTYDDGYVVIIRFTQELSIRLETYNEDKFNEWLKLLGVEIHDSI